MTTQKPVIMDEEDVVREAIKDCREDMLKAFTAYFKAQNWSRKSDAQFRLQLGELTAQEIRTVRAVLNNILDEEVSR